jgi:hypothetical protein
MDTFAMHELRQEVDRKYVGFNPQSGKVKPVHIATGAFRVILGQSFTAEGIKKLSYVMGAKGQTPKGNQLSEVIKYLSDNNVIDLAEISEQEIGSFRWMLQKLLNTDNGVYGIDDHMLAYSAGASQFVTAKGILEDAGEFIGGLIKEYCPSLGEYIATILKNNDDAISLIFEPVIDRGDVNPGWRGFSTHRGCRFENPTDSLKTLPQ